MGETAGLLFPAEWETEGRSPKGVSGITHRGVIPEGRGLYPAKGHQEVSSGERDRGGKPAEKWKQSPGKAGVGERCQGESVPAGILTPFLQHSSSSSAGGRCL